ncbi:LOH12CR1 [Cordylochernes scorpioides]|uniref:BLOC-1-related complex subunit 5 n=1 Tax=Cordylochernes scorpioides TaxID=51811 RepID=A0ABY6LHD2_9ARAC|nr:LOH12CR1 [Cordylochernes scorpioides]
MAIIGLEKGSVVNLGQNMIWEASKVLSQFFRAMGSELSSHGAPAKHQTSEPAPRSSPRPSISSDADIPYVSYTGSVPDSLEVDPDYIRVQNLPSFTPILRSSSASLKDAPDWVRSQIDPRPMYEMCRKYQEMLNSCAESVANSQNQLASHMREVDIAIVSLRNQLVEKQKLFAHHCEQLGKVHDVSATLQRCHRSLTETCEMMEALNSQLPPAERLDPFVMVTG